jgi:hypothetical protein
METIVYNDVIDKSDWGDGPWLDEPDKVQWPDEATGLPCMVKRGPGGNWCGYVGVAEGHPLYKKGYTYSWDDEVEGPTVNQLEVHGGVTYTDLCAEHEPGEEGHAICHVPGPNDPDPVWWIGFDCGHAWDLSPERTARYAKLGIAPFADEVYRDIYYVKAQTVNLAKQLHAIDN